MQSATSFHVNRSEGLSIKSLKKHALSSFSKSTFVNIFSAILLYINHPHIKR